MQTKSGHLTYCTNIHAGESWRDHFAAIKQHFPVIKNRLSPDAPMAIGLRLSNAASLELLVGDNLSLFRQWLLDNQAYVFTMNGFPYGGFHHTRVKDQVHSPDWTTPERVDYTIRLFDILVQLLPEGMDGGVSTSPLSYRFWFPSPEKLVEAKQTATRNVLQVAEYLAGLHQSTGKMLHLDIEPEPDGMLETGLEFLEWFEMFLLTDDQSEFPAEFGLVSTERESMIKAHVRLCYDVCHFAIGYEPYLEILKTLDLNGIKIGKIQISAALKALLGNSETERSRVKAAFERFDEPVYLHQVVARRANGSLARYRDLNPALADIGNPDVLEWRAHFHVPVFEQDFGDLQSTQQDIRELLRIQKNTRLTEHLEVETYTWEVLQESLKLPLQESIIRELEWVVRQLQ